MRFRGSRADARRLAQMGAAELRAFLSKCGPRELLMLDAAFEMWGDEGQFPPVSEGWRTWLMMAGRGYGKTRAGAEWVHNLSQGAPRRIALVSASIDEARSVMVEGVSGILSVARRERVKVIWEPSLKQLTWPRGTIAKLYSGDHGDGLRGPEHHFAWCDELAKWGDAESAWMNLQLGMRGSPRARVLVTTTPRPMALLRRLRADTKNVVTTGGKTMDNLSLPVAFIEAMVDAYGKTRVGRQELDGELIEDVEGSLWPRRLIEKCRFLRDRPHSTGSGQASTGSVLPQDERFFGGRDCYDRVVVGVDPPVGVGEQCDACGIVVVARRGEEYFVLADESVQGLSPEGWARAVAQAAERWSADRVVAEANNGGEMVRSCLVAAGATVRPKLVHASRGKVARAEPIALRFEAGKAWFVGTFPALEDELAGLSIGGHYEGPGRSPDRADAMVWAITELAEGRRSIPGVRQL